MLSDRARAEIARRVGPGCESVAAATEGTNLSIKKFKKGWLRLPQLRELLTTALAALWGVVEASSCHTNASPSRALVA